MRENKIQPFISGVHNSVNSEIISVDAAKSSISWKTQDGRIELVRGRQEYGINTTIEDEVDTPTPARTGAVYAQILAPKQDGTRVHYRKINDRIQLYEDGEWRDVISSLSTGGVFFAPYASLAGNFLYIGSPDGFFKINLANPRSYKDMYDSTKNHKGDILINESRTFLWNRSDPPADRTALYLSKIDPQGTNYTTVSNEDIGNFGEKDYDGTLTEATVTRFVFNVSFTATTAGGEETLQDDQNGNLTSPEGGTGTINYATGEFDISFSDTIVSGDVLANYQYEDSNVGGITDFTYSAPRVAGEGDFIPQEYLGEAILNVIPFDNKYYSFKTTSVYELDLTADDTNATNTVFRSDIGLKSARGICATGKGIAYIDTANPDKPELTLLVRNPVGGNLEPIALTPLFAWENYVFDDCIMDTWGEFILVSARTPGVELNNRLFLVNTSQKYSVDPTYYGVSSLSKTNGRLFGGSPISETVYELFNGNDDLGSDVDNFWIGKDDNMGDDRLKKTRYFEIKGLIDPNQHFEIYATYDDDSPILVGTVRGDASYVDLSSPQLIEAGVIGTVGSELVGGSPIGTQTLGGGMDGSSGTDTTIAYPFYTRIKMHTPKFRVRRITLIAKEYGFVGIEMMKDFDVMIYEQRIPKRFRQKQYVAKDGIETDLPVFQN